MRTINQSRILRSQGVLLLAAIVLMAMYGCGSSSGSPASFEQAAPVLPVLPVMATDATVYQEYATSLEGSQDIEIRPQVDGYLDRILVDEGAYVRKGQLLFQINDRPFVEQLNNAKAGLTAAKASLTNAEINLNKLRPLVEKQIISPVQLQTAQANYDAAKASVEQARAMVSNAEINLGYTRIKAPVDGYIGRIPHKTGSVIGMGTQEALTVISEIREIYAYFSLSENDYLQFQQEFAGKTFEEKIKNMPPVELRMADGSLYPHKGKVQLVSGQFDNTVGAINFRASFPNPDRLLRSGNTGKLRLPLQLKAATLVPQEATFAIQDKIFVFALTDSNKVASRPIVVSGKTPAWYFVQSGLNPGEKIVYAGIGNLQDGMAIVPQEISGDSLLKAKPL